MTRAFNDAESQRRDALYQALRPIGAFETALQEDSIAARHQGTEYISLMAMAIRDAYLLKLAIRALTARQEVTPGNN